MSCMSEIINKNKLLIIGAGGHGKVAADIAIKMKRWGQIAFLDDDETIQSSMGIEVIGKSADVFAYMNDYDLFVAIGSNQTREKIQNELIKAGANIATFIHPSAVIGQEVVIGGGTVVMAGAVINCCSKTGTGCIVNTGATIDHDNILEDYVHISPGAHLAGMVKIGKGSWIGIGAVVSNHVSIFDDCIIGAGAAVIRDITEEGTYVGVPAKKVKGKHSF